MREEKKYDILPGVEIPDMKKIQEAASDFSISEVGDVDIKTVSYEPVFEAAAPGVSPEELARLQQLGVKVAEDEERSKLVSQAKMAKIMNQAVQAPSSIGDLKASHIAQLDEEKRKQLEESQKEADKLKAEEEAKNKAREERRILQQRLLEESREKAAKDKYDGWVYRFGTQWPYAYAYCLFFDVFIPAEYSNHIKDYWKNGCKLKFNEVLGISKQGMKYAYKRLMLDVLLED